MYRKILVPLDGSERAERILNHVAELAEQFDAEIVLLTVFHPEPIVVPTEPYYKPFNYDFIQKQLADAEDYLNQQCGKLYQREIRTHARVSEGPVIETILAVARQEDVDLIAIASHGRTGLPRMIYGSIADGVLHNTDRPLLLIRSLD